MIAPQYKDIRVLYFLVPDSVVSEVRSLCLAERLTINNLSLLDLSISYILNYWSSSGCKVSVHM